MTTLTCLLLSVCLPAEEPRTFFVTRSMDHEQLFPYLEQARPDIVQIGQYGAMFHGLANHEKAKGTPMQLPFTGERRLLSFQRDMNRRIHGLGLKTVGHFRLVKAYGNWKKKTGFIDYYENHWPTDILGPKPHPELLPLLQRDSRGIPIQVSRYEQSQIALCLTSPHTRQMFKQMLKVAIEHGVDGVITTYNYHLGCSCNYCQNSFRNWLSFHFPETDLAGLGIADLENHEFETIPARISGYPDPATARELDWLAMRWAAENFKTHYDEIFIKYGRSLSPDLLVAQWNHIGHVNNGEERMFLPLEKWGSGESYFWESGGASFVGKNLNLLDHKAGDAWLNCLVMRELGKGKPFLIGKYDGIRMAASMAEGFATGGLGMGRYMRFEDPTGFATLVRYTRFRNNHDHLFSGAESLANIALVLPRMTLWSGRLDAMSQFRALGKKLLARQILFDVISDENLDDGRLKRYDALILPESSLLNDHQASALSAYEKQGGMVHRDKENLVTSLEKITRFQIKAPWTVRAVAYQNTRGKTILHLVNYDRDEGDTKTERQKNPANERPRAVHGISIAVESESSVSSVRLYQPESDESVEIPFDSASGGIRFTVPKILVYGVVEID